MTMSTTFANMDGAPGGLDGRVGVPVCERCAGTSLRPTRISTAFWQGEGLVVVRDIPAMVCPGCGLDYVADATVVRLERMRGTAFRDCKASESLIVPVFRFDGGGG